MYVTFAVTFTILKWATQTAASLPELLLKTSQATGCAQFAVLTNHTSQKDHNILQYYIPKGGNLPPFFMFTYILKR